ncbi:MAG: hypothetical protein E6R04_08330 [Spirochaetes bacterium]|nr:MAG: hypothetical protein E6R04_08330 [Spirochaetota bacterium]
MIDLTDTNAKMFRALSASTTLKGYVANLTMQADRLADLVTKSFPVHHVDQPTVGSILLFAEDGWEGTFAVVLRAALGDAFTDPELLTLVAWTRNDDPATRKDSPYIKHVGQAGDDVLLDSDGNECVQFFDGTLVDLDDVVAVQF